jgi:hypothetical protein
MAYFGTSINDSATIYGEAGAELSAPSFKAAAYDSNGNIVIASTAGANAIGLFVAEHDDTVDQGDPVTIQIKDIGYWQAGAAVAIGAELTTDANGKAVTAESGNFITAIALEAASAADDVIKVQICKAGYKSATA